MKPFVKWAGGKRQLVETLTSLMPKDYNHYYEPFVGGGALFLTLKPENATINDLNADLMACYKCFETESTYNELINKLNAYYKDFSEKQYYEVRNLDRDANYINLDHPSKASRFIYLNKTCYNGLARVNSKGYFNTPFGFKTNPKFYEEDNFKEIREYFKNNEINILNLDYKEGLKDVKPEDFVYLDPPYDKTCSTSFTSYNNTKFGKKEQKELAKVFKELTDKNVYCMLSNADTEFIRELYKDYTIHKVQTRRCISSNGFGRTLADEVIITNYEENKNDRK